MNSPLAVRPLTAATAPNFEVGRMTEHPAEERAWLGHDQVGPEILPAKGGYVEVGKHELGIFGIGQRSAKGCFGSKAVIGHGR
jgi:hypothetical protein